MRPEGTNSTESAGEREFTSWEAQSFARSKALKSDFVFLAPSTLSIFNTIKDTWKLFYLPNVCSQIKHLFTNVSIAPFATKNFLMSSFVNLDFNLIKNGHFPPNFTTVLKSCQDTEHQPYNFYCNMKLCI